MEAGAASRFHVGFHLAGQPAMSLIKSFAGIVCLAILGLGGGAVSAAVATAAEAQFVPREIDIAGAIREHFSTQKGYKSGDFITHKMVEEALQTLERKTKWKLDERDRKALLKLTPDDKSFLAQQLTSKAGKSFARQIASMPLGYDKLDRLAQLPQGRSTVERLVAGPDGYKLLEYMTSSRGGHELSRMLSADGKGNFEKPTGKIYDEKQLVMALTQLHKSAVAHSAAATNAAKLKQSGTVRPTKSAGP